MTTTGALKYYTLKGLDALTMLWSLLVLFIAVGGGFSFMLGGLKVKAHSVQNPVIILGVLFLLRKGLQWTLPVQEIPLITLIAAIVRRVTHLLQTYPRITLGIMAGGYAVIMSIVTIIRHVSYHSHAFDLAIFDQLLWSITRGHGLYSSLLERHFFGEHLSPILFVLAPLYWLTASPKTLLILQSLTFASGAIPIYWFARKKLESAPFALLFVCIYVWYVPVRNVNLYDFHPIALTTPLLLFAFFALDQRKYGYFGLLMLLAMSCQEETFLVAIILGVYIALIQRRWVGGLVFAGLALLAFIVAVGIIIPHYRQGPFGFVHRYSYLGASIPDILITLVSRPFYVLQHLWIPEKRAYVTEIFGPVGFLSLFSPSHLLLAVPTLFQNLLSDFPPQYSIQFQYTAPLTPFVFISAICGARNVLTHPIMSRFPGCALSTAARHSLIAGLLVVIALFDFHEKLPSFPITARTRLAHEFLRMIPPDAPVSAQSTYVPHLAHRRELYMFPDVKTAEYIFLDLSSPYRGSVPDLDYFKIVAELLNAAEYGVVAHEQNLVVLRKGADPSNNRNVPRFEHEDDTYRIDGALVLSRTGTITGSHLIAQAGRDRPGYIMYGPYFKLAPGTYTFALEYRTGQIEAGANIGKWDIGFTIGQKVEIIESGQLLAMTESAGVLTRTIVVTEQYQDAPVEFRVYYAGTDELQLDNVMIKRIAK